MTRLIRLSMLLCPALGLTTMGLAQSVDACAALTAFRLPGQEMVITKAAFEDVLKTCKPSKVKTDATAAKA